MNTKTKALSLLAVVAFAAVAGSLLFAMETVKADDSTSVASDQSTSTAVTSPSPTPTDNFTLPDGGFMDSRGGMMDHGFGGMRQGMDQGMMGSIQVSSDYTTNVTNIVNNDTDVQTLINEGYNITSIHPVITTSFDGNGNVATKASTADVTLVGTNGRALVVVDLTQAKVTKIVTFTVTEIDK